MMVVGVATVALIAGLVAGVIGMLAWASRHAPVMEDEPSRLDIMDGVE